MHYAILIDLKRLSFQIIKRKKKKRTKQLNRLDTQKKKKKKNELNKLFNFIIQLLKVVWS